MNMNSGEQSCTIYLVRHGESEWNVRGLIQGQSDSALTQKGEAQALKLAKELKAIKFDAVFSSDLMRAKNTADIIALEKNLAVETSKALIERNFGKLDGKPGKQIGIFYELQRKADPDSYKFYGIESDEKIANRMFAFLKEIAVVYCGKTALIVTHGSLVRVLLMQLGYATLDQIPPFSVGNGAIVKLESDGVNFFVKSTERISFKF